jgi:hypothetical protein
MPAGIQIPLVLSSCFCAYLVGGASVMASHQRKIYQNDTGQCWWLVAMNRPPPILVEDKPSERRTEILIRELFDS